MTNGGTRIPAVVIGQTISALGTLRSLARIGIDAYTVTDPGEVVRYSRWYRPVPGYERLRPDSLPDWVQALPFDRVVLFPCSDHTVQQASRLSNTVRQRAMVCAPSPGVLEKFTDKEKFARLLERLDVPRPGTWLVADGKIPDSLDGADFTDAFLKPIDSQSFMGRFGIKAQRVDSKDDAMVQLQRITDEGHAVLLQEYVPGPAHNHYFIDGFVDRHGKIKALFARQRIRIYPPDFGNSSFMKSVALEEMQGAEEPLRHLLRESGFRGIFSAEFKLDTRDNVFKLIEINARPWWYVEFATRCGINVCEMAYADALEFAVEGVRDYVEGASNVYTRRDYHACRHAIQRGGTSVVGCLLDWIRSSRPIFAWYDPRPALVMSGKFLLRNLRRPFARLFRAST